MHLKMLSVQVICCIYLLTLLTNVSIEANSVDPDQTAPVRLLWVYTVCDLVASKTFQTTFVVIGA